MRRREFITLSGSAAAAWPHLAGAQPGSKVARIGLLVDGSLENAVVRSNFEAIRQGFDQLGYVLGKNIVFEERAADGVFERLPAMAAELVRLKVDFIIAVRRQINCYGSGLFRREAPAHQLIDVKRRLHGGSSVCVGWSVV
jgi:putative ABC transport system substrate-binding protein